MAAENCVMAPVTFGGQGVGFAKLQGENFSYYMVKYSIILGRKSESSEVDLDLSKFGEKMNKVSRHHARIFYDFEHHHFALEVLGKNGCKVEGVTYLPGSDPIKLNSQDFIEVAYAKMYFLLPSRSMFETIAAQRSTLVVHAQGSSAMPPDHHQGRRKSKKKNKKSSRGGKSSTSNIFATASADPTGAPGEHDNQILLPKEEKDVVSSIATLISDISGSEWVPMPKLHEQFLERFGKIWSEDYISRFLTPEEISSAQAKGRPWSMLSQLLRKHPVHFEMDTTVIGEEFVRVKAVHANYRGHPQHV